MKTAFILAGFDLQETATSADYLPLRCALREKGYKVIPVDISWRNNTPSKYSEEFVSKFNKLSSDENIIIGNSFGAVVAFISATKLNAHSLFLCSLSPFFKEDRAKRPDSYAIRYFGKKRMEDLWSLSAKDTAESINATRCFVLYGEKEKQTSPILVDRCRQTAKQIIGATLIEVKNAPHDMSHDAYTAAILKLIK